MSPCVGLHAHAATQAAQGDVAGAAVDLDVDAGRCRDAKSVSQRRTIPTLPQPLSRTSVPSLRTSVSTLGRSSSQRSVRSTTMSFGQACADVDVARVGADDDPLHSVGDD